MFLSFFNPRNLTEDSGGVPVSKEVLTPNGTPLVEGRLMAVDTELGKSVRQLSPGAQFRGEVRDVTGTRVTIQSGNESISARFDSRVPISIGEQLNFVIKENTEDKFVISPVLNSALSAEDQMLYKALDSAGLAATDKNIDMVAALLKNQMPVNEATVKQLLSQALKFPKADAADIVFLNKKQIPVTQESLKQLAQLREEAPVLKQELSAIAKELPGAVLELVKLQKFPEARQLLLTFFPESLDSESGQNTQEQPVGSENAHPLQQLFHALKQGDTVQAKEFLLEKGDVLSRQILKTDALQPENFTKAEVQETVQNIAKQMFNILELSEANPGLSKLSESAVSILNQAAFLADVNGEGKEGKKKGAEGDRRLVKLPLKMGSKLTQGDLYVYSGKKRGSGTSAREEISILLHLNLNALKNLNIMVKLKRKDLSVQIGTETEEVRDYLKEGLPQLVEKLKKKGLFVNAVVAKEEDHKEKVSEFLDVEEQKHEVKRYAFDMRV